MEWITAREAIGILAGHCDGYEAEAEALRLGAATGAFAAKADRMIRRVAPWLNEEGYLEADTDWLVPFDVWGALEIGFARGLDHGHLKAHPDWRTTINLTGLRFEKEPLLEYAAAMGEPAHSNKAKREREEEAARSRSEWLRRAEATLQASRDAMEAAKASAPPPARAVIDRARKLGADLAPRSDPYIGLAEAAAWVATRDHEVAAAVHAITYYKNGQGGNFWQSTTWINFGDLLGAFNAIAARCSAGADLTAVGRKSAAPSFESIPPLEWLGARIWFQDDPDVMAPASSVSAGQNIIGPIWTHVKMPRQSVLEIWPADGGEAPVLSLRVGAPLRLVASSPALKPPSIADVREWIRRGIEDGKSQRKLVEGRKSAFPDNAEPPRKLVRDIYSQEYEAKHGEKPAAGAPARM